MITNEKHLLYILKVKKERLNFIIEHLSDFYYSFEKIKIDHATGKPRLDSQGKQEKRQLNAPNDELKKIQKCLYIFLKNNTLLPTYVFGGVKGQNNIRNARYHQGNKYFFTTDLKSFFPSINNCHVYDMFIREGCTPSIARILTKITTLNYELPQGTPTSTIIANLVFKPHGNRLAELALKNNIKFSMFVDDITMSSKKDFKNLIPVILDIIKSSGFSINHRKTHYKTKNPIVTGIICHNNRLLAPNIYKKKLARLKKEQPKGNSTANRINGLDNYINSIEKA